MAHLYRLAAAILLAVTLGMCWTPAKAFPMPPAATEYLGPVTGATWMTSPEAAFAQWITYANATSTAYVYTLKSCVGANCVASAVYKPSYGGGPAPDQPMSLNTRLAAPVCPANSTGTTSCTCTPPSVENAAHDGCAAPVIEDRCKGVALLDSTAFGDRSITVPGKISSGLACLPDTGSAATKGCSVDFSRTASYQKANGDWVSEGSYQYGSGSSTCSTASTTPGSSTSTITPVPAAVNPCPKGQPGQVNGVDVCIPFSSAPGATETTKTKTASVTPPGGGPETQTTTSETTKCEGGTCTTTSQTTVTSGSSTSVTTSTTAQSKGDFCEKNKQAVECGGSGKGSGFGGTCSAGFSCDGDAVQCAIAQEQHKRNCLFFDTTSADVAGLDAEKDRQGSVVTATVVNISASSFDQSNALGVSASCVQDKTITIGPSSHSFTATLPLSRVCEYLGWLGYLNLAVSFILAARIVGRG